ncbi:unnamed protein product [Arabidopsis lyrata]|nr:unnamed protein product [Arabidopsis lyrata]
MSNSGAGEEPPRTKKLKLSSLPSTSEFSSLPDEIVLSCLARVPRSDYASLSLASKCLRSIVVSPEIYDVRSLIGGRILWCEAEELDWRIHEGMVWREVMGLKTLTDTLCASKLVNYGGRMSEHWKSCKRKMVRHGLTSDELDKLLPGHILSNSGPNMLLFWDVLSPKKLEIWCAEISLKRRKEGVEICGKIEWSEAVMTFKPPPLHQHHCKLLYSLPHNL